MKYDLVFEGGGAKGMAFVGACDALLRRGHEFDRLLGTSAGAITAALLAAGYTSGELLDALTEKEGGRSVFAGFMGKPAPFTDQEIRASELRGILEGVDLALVPDGLERWIDDQVAKALVGASGLRHVFALVERGGWFAAERFVSWLETRLDSGEYRGEPRAFSKVTLEQMFARTGVDLSVVASDTTDGKLLVLNHHTAPRCPLVRAVRMSMSIPLVWDEVVWKEGWGPYLGRDLAGHVVVDGGLLSNFPIELFISDAPQVVKLMGPKRETAVLGLLIDEELPVPTAKRGALVRVDVDPKELRMVKRLRRLVDAATSAHDKLVIDEYGHLVVRLPAAGYGTMEFDMSDERRGALVDAGRAAVAAHLDAPARPLPQPRGVARVAGRVQTRADRIATHLLEGGAEGG